MARFRPVRAPVPWTNQDIDLFHGTLEVHVPAIMAGINVSAGKATADFGRGFYTTTGQHRPFPGLGNWRSEYREQSQRSSGSG